MDASLQSGRIAYERQAWSEAYAARNAEDRTWDIIGAVEDASNATGASMAQVALRWLVDRPAVTSVILGARTREQLKDNMAADSVKLPPEVTAKLTEVSAPNPPSYPYGTGGTNQRNRKLEGGR